MKVRRSASQLDLYALPLDGLDMLLLSRMDAEIALDELVDMAPCDALEVERRVHELVMRGLLELVTTEPSSAQLARDMPELDLPLLEDEEPAMDASAWLAPEPVLPANVADLVGPLPSSSTSSAAFEAVLFDADPPSTVHSLMSSVRVEVAFRTTDSQAPAVREPQRSAVFRKSTDDADADDDEPTTDRLSTLK